MENKDTQLSKSSPKTLQDWFATPEFQNRISDCLNNTVNPKQFLAISLNSVNKIPKLKQATVPSLLSCFVKCAELQLLPDGRAVHILPYEDKKKGIVNAQFILGYQGMVDLVYRKCNIIISAMDVRENDIITCENSIWKHIIKTPSKKSRGNVIGYIGFATLPDGRIKTDFIDSDEIEDIKKSSAGYKYAEKTGSKDSVWHTKTDEMGKKSVIRRLFKTLPLSVEVQQAIKEDDEKDYPQYSNTMEVQHANPFNLLEEKDGEEIEIK